MPGSVKTLADLAFAYLGSGKITDVTTISFGGESDYWSPTSIYGSYRGGPFETGQISTIILWTTEDITSADRRAV